jgi:SAM-dependent methyltransferase
MRPPSTISALARLEAHLVDVPAARALSPERYALTHAAYEARSDQRGRLRAWMVDQVPRLVDHVTDRPVDVLGVGVGDGSIDGPVAARLAAGGREVRYDGIEPHAPSLHRFVQRLEGLHHAGLRTTGHATDFARFTPGGPYDVIHFVHSLYYVPDLGAAIDHAMRLLRPGGTLAILISPREPLSVLSALLAPQPEHPHWFSDAVRAALEGRGLHIRSAVIDGRLDVRSLRDEPTGVGAHVLDFLLQCHSADLDPTVLALVHTHLAEIALPDARDAVPHPLDALLVRRRD